MDIGDERSRPRTVHSLKTDKPRDLFLLAQRYTLLALLVDTEYGSATYAEVTRPARFEVRVSTTGLLVREVGYRSGSCALIHTDSGADTQCASSSPFPGVH